MVTTYLLIFFMLLYCFSEGITEGYTWANADRRRNNLLIRNTLRNKEARGILDYHAWRYGELIGLLGTAIVSYFYPGGLLTYTLTIFGALSLGIFFYEVSLHYIASGSPLVPDRDFHILGLVIRIPWFYPVFMLFLGFICLIGAYLYV